MTTPIVSSAMDFHSLTRRELQTLCKKNKIPANITNIAMADALKALEIVEGMEELSNPSESETAISSVESPEKMVITSPAVPRTGGRTSTQRKPIKEPESSQTLTRTRRGTRRTLAAEVEETNNGVPETPAGPSGRKRAPAASARRKMETQFNESGEDQKNGDQIVQTMKDVPETPAAASGRRLATAASSRRKMETDLREDKKDVNNRGLKEESSVRRVYSTRRSVRLSEMKMTESNPKEKEAAKAIKIDSIFNEMPKDLDDLGEDSESTGMSGVDFSEISEESTERTNDSEVLSGQKWDVLPEKGRDFDGHQGEDCKATREEISEAFNEIDVVSVSDEQSKNLIIEKDRVVVDGVHDESKDDDDSKTISEVVSEKCDESDILSVENLVKALDLKDEVLQHKGSDVSAVDKLSSDMENSTEVLKLENEKELNTDKDTALEDSAAVIGLDQNQDIELGLASEEECNSKTSSDDEEIADQDRNQDAELGLASEKELNGSETVDHDLNLYVELKLASEEEIPGGAFSDDAETDPELYGIQNLESKLTAEEEHNSKISVAIDDVEAHSDLPGHGSEQLDSENLNFEEFIMDSNNASEVFSADKESDSEKSVTGESEKQVSVAFSDLENMNLQFAEEPMPETRVGVDVIEIAAQESNGTTPHELTVPLAVLGSDSGHIVALVASMTPRKKSSRTIHVLDDNKENIDTREKEKKNTAEDNQLKSSSLNDLSMRQLSKMLKEKLQITNNNNEEKNIAKAARAALQTLPENRLVAMAEPEKEN